MNASRPKKFFVKLLRLTKTNNFILTIKWEKRKRAIDRGASEEERKRARESEEGRWRRCKLNIVDAFC